MLTNVISSSSTSLIDTKQLNLNGYIGANIKGRVLQIVWNLQFELAPLVTDVHGFTREFFSLRVFDEEVFTDRDSMSHI